MYDVEFKAIPFRKGGKVAFFHMQPIVRPTKLEGDVYEEIAKESGTNLSADSLKGLFEMMINTTARLVEKDGRPRRLGNLKFMVSLKGKLESPYSAFDEATCEAAVIPSLMKGWERKIDPREVDIDNVKIGKRVRLTPTLGTVGERQWGRGDKLLLNGENIQLIEGDSVTVVWMEGEEEKSVALEVESTAPRMTVLKWPKELDGVAAGMKMMLVWKSRGGIVDGVWQTRYRKLTLVEKEG
jgi:hypothetical protein